MTGGEKALVICLAAYLAMAVFTFGYAAAHARISTYGHTRTEDGAFAGILAAMTWPLYWSWELQEQKP